MADARSLIPDMPEEIFEAPSSGPVDSRLAALCWLEWTVQLDDPSSLVPSLVNGILDIVGSAIMPIPDLLQSAFGLILQGVGLREAKAIFVQKIAAAKPQSSSIFNCSAPPGESRLELKIEMGPQSVVQAADLANDLGGLAGWRRRLQLSDLLQRTLELPLPESASSAAALQAAVRAMPWPELFRALQPLALPNDMAAIPGLLTITPPPTSSTGESGLSASDLFPDELPLLPVFSGGMCLSLTSPVPYCFDVNATINIPLATLFEAVGLPGGNSNDDEQLFSSSTFQRAKDVASDVVFGLILPDLEPPEPDTLPRRLEQVQGLMASLQNPCALLNFARGFVERARAKLPPMLAATTNFLENVGRAVHDFVAQTLPGVRRRRRLQNVQGMVEGMEDLWNSDQGQALRRQLSRMSRVIKLGIHLSLGWEWVTAEVGTPHEH